MRSKPRIIDIKCNKCRRLYKAPYGIHKICFFCGSEDIVRVKWVTLWRDPTILGLIAFIVYTLLSIIAVFVSYARGHPIYGQAFTLSAIVSAVLAFIQLQIMPKRIVNDNQ